MKMLTDISVLDDDLLEDFYDFGALARGRAYSYENRVTLLESTENRLKAVCRGSGRGFYLVNIKWRVAANSSHARSASSFVDLDDSCSCPLGGNCKHCVATILTARRDSEVMPSATISNLTRNWRIGLVDISTASPGPGGATTGLALQFTVSKPRATRFDSGKPLITVRPMRRGKTGKWIKTGASWREVASPNWSTLGDVDPLQRAALRSLALTAASNSYYRGNEALSVTGFDSDLWHYLTQAVDAGVELIRKDSTQTVELSAVPARVGVDLTTDPSDSVEASPRLILEDESFPTDSDEAGLIGSPAHGVWISQGNRLRIAPLPAQLHPTIQRLTVLGGFTVPASDVEEFLGEYQPELSRHAEVASSDGSVRITISKFDGFVVDVERTTVDSANLMWSVRYRRGDQVSLHPLRPLGGRGRDPVVEAAAVDELQVPTHLRSQVLGEGGLPVNGRFSGPSLISWFAEVLPWIESEENIEVRFSGDHPGLRKATEDPLISLEVTDRSDRADGNDWFNLDVTVTIDGEAVDFVSLFAALSNEHEVFILPSGTWISLEREEFTKLRQLIEEAHSLAEPGPDGSTRINRFQSSWWDELTALGVVAKQSQRWRDSVDRMAALTVPELVTPPISLDAVLRPYQQDGLDWLAFLHGNRLGGILADDMGLGKTVQTLALALHVLEGNPDARFLVVAPTSVVENWAREAARFAPTLNVRTIRETHTRRGTALEDEIGGANLVVTSYALFRLEFEAYEQLQWKLLLIDEAQFVKNHQGKTYKCIRQLDVATKIAITGTPIENSLMDLWSLLSITAPGLYPDPKRFDGVFRKPIESGDAPEMLPLLRRRIAPLMRRRTKDAVLSELPPKTEQTVQVELSPRHSRIYSTHLQRQRQKVLGLVEDVQKNRFEILKSLTILRQMALDPGLVDQSNDHIGSAKLDRLMDDLALVIEEGHRALVFSQFTRFLSRLRTRLDEAGIEHAYLDGRTRKRDEAIASFKDGNIPVFVISLKAGGVGLNLTEADYCFILDPWWNPATETQAVDRTHRMGQVNPVMVYRYVSTDTIEEKVMELKARKADLFNSVMDDNGDISGALTEDDIRGLLDLD